MLRQSFGGNYDFALHKKVNVCVSIPLTLFDNMFIYLSTAKYMEKMHNSVIKL